MQIPNNYIVDNFTESNRPNLFFIFLNIGRENSLQLKLLKK